MKEIVLASASPRRSELLRQIGLNFKIQPSNIDENIDPLSDPCESAKKLSYHKALNIADAVKASSLVIGADTIVVKDGILGKPADAEQAFDMLCSLRGRWHEVITGVSVLETPGTKSITECEVTRVKMRNLPDETIRAYIRTGEVFDKAGAYGIQGFGSILVERIEGCYFNVVGLPLTRLSIMLEEFGVKIL